jgi:high-affinity Fe2+/Pb2+ permease
VVQVIIRAILTISKSFRNYRNSIGAKNGIKELQETGILGTAPIPRMERKLPPKP